MDERVTGMAADGVNALIRLLIVMVRYRTPLIDSQTIRTLGACLEQSKHLERVVSVLVWDNSPEADRFHSLPFPCEYHRSDENVGVSGAYNFAMQIAEQRGIPWLLLLDQDTELPPDFIGGMCAHALHVESDDRIAIVAPTVVMNSVPVSPKIMSRFGVATDPPLGTVETTAKELIVMNSGMLLRVSSLRAVGGYSMDFWLDFSDRYVCHLLFRHGFQFHLAGDLRIDHDVSLVAGTQSLARYSILMGAQDAYFTQFKSFPRNVVFCLRLLRGAWQTRRSDPDRSRIMQTHLKRRLTVPRARRLAEWRGEAAAQRKATWT